MNTKQKQLVYELVADNCEHRTAEDVYRAAKARMPQIAMGTVYRNLSQLVTEGKIRKYTLSEKSPACYQFSGGTSICSVTGAARSWTFGAGI
mgnify:CR=1 FL=1